MNISFLDHSNFLDTGLKKKLENNVIKIIKYLNLPEDCEICISIINDRNMRELNKKYRNIDRTTDILSFPQYKFSDNNLLGDLIISYETALRHSKKYNITIETEMINLLIHGILHLIGHDHKKKKEAEIMRDFENKIKKYLK
ncbi:MAG: rRNA maturation RNase YbeY [Candidatus Dadabacteria bacterium]|nr:rRNA maturation RNase YbeY [Candidatus Dadabacteria bacterium]